MFVVGLTGGIGTGKSTVTRMFADRGADVIDADRVAREVVEPGTEAFEEIVDRFGEEVVDEHGGLDRERLGSMVFSDEQARQDLNAIVHPRVHERIASELKRLGDDERTGLVVVDVPLLVEAKAARRYDAVVVVVAPREVRVERLRRDRGMDPEEVRARMAAQAGDQERLAVATHVVDNGGDLAHLEAQVDALHRELIAAEARERIPG